MRVQRGASRIVLAILTAAYLFLIYQMTLRAEAYGSTISHGIDRLLQWFSQQPDTAWITFDKLEFAANIAMFMPFGALMLLWFGVRLWWLVPILGLLLSGMIEGLQFVFLSDSRVADVRDLISNTLGATAGMLVMLLLWFLLTPPMRRRP